MLRNNVSCSVRYKLHTIDRNFSSASQETYVCVPTRSLIHDEYLQCVSTYKWLLKINANPV